MTNPACITFVQDVNQSSANKFIDLCNRVLFDKFNDLHILISSHGGHIMSGIAMFQYLMSVPVKVTTYNIGSIDSVANAVFLGGVERIAAPHSTFLFHPSSWTFAQPTTIPKNNLIEIVESLIADEKRMIDIITSRTNMSQDELVNYFHLGSTKDAQFALDKGIVHDVRHGSIPKDVPTFHVPM